MLIKLSDGCYVAHDQIAEIKINSYNTHIIVRTKDGVGHNHDPEWGQGIFAALDALVAKVNSAEVKHAE